MSDQQVLAYNPNETTMTVWDPLPPESLISGKPVQTGNEYFETFGGKVTSGIWDCSTFESVIEPYPVNEFMLLLEGSVSLVDQNGNEQSFSAGDAFYIPQGLQCGWRQSGYVKKFYVIFEHQEENESIAMSAVGQLKISHDTSLKKMEGLNCADFIGAIPEMSINVLYEDTTGQFDIGVWESTAMTRVPGKIGRSELMYILQGEGEIVNADGVRFGFKSGDTFMVPIGMGYQWHSEGYVKKIFCSFQPA